MIRKLLEAITLTNGKSLDGLEIQSFELLINELRKWNNKINLTSLSGDEDIVAKHIFDSLELAEYISAGENVLDIGSGAGFPSLPLKIVKPEIHMVSVDAVQKKIMFQKHIARQLQICNFEPLHTRVEKMHTGKYAAHFDVIVSRAFSRLDQFIMLAAPLLKDSGRIIAMKGPALSQEVEVAADVLLNAKLAIQGVFQYQLPFGKGQRRLITLKCCN